MSTATSTDTQSPELHPADSHDLIRVHGARVNNLKDINVEIPKRRLTVFTGVSGSGKSSLVFGTIAAESQRMINETYSAFVQGFMPTLARPDVDVLDGLTTAIIVDQERMGANPRSTLGTVTDADAMLRILFSRLGSRTSAGPARSRSTSPRCTGRRVTSNGRQDRSRRAQLRRHRRDVPALRGPRRRLRHRPDRPLRREQVAQRGRVHHPRLQHGRLVRADLPRIRLLRPGQADQEVHQGELHDLLYKEPTKIKVEGINLTYEGLIPTIQKSMLSKDVDSLQPHVRAFVERAVVFTTCPDCDGTRLSEAARSSKINGVSIANACAMQISDLAEWVRGIDEPSVAPLLDRCSETLDSFVEIGLGYLSLDRPSRTCRAARRSARR